jgi:anti-sigma B factor antagonist
MLFTATIEKLPSETAVVTFSGPMSLGTSLKLADSQVRTALDEGVTRVVFDMSDVDYIDSAGLGLLVYMYGALNQKNGRLRLCGVCERIMSLFKVTKVDTFLDVDGCRADSLAALD